MHLGKAPNSGAEQDPLADGAAILDPRQELYVDDALTSLLLLRCSIVDDRYLRGQPLLKRFRNKLPVCSEPRGEGSFNVFLFPLLVLLSRF